MHPAFAFYTGSSTYFIVLQAQPALHTKNSQLLARARSKTCPDYEPSRIQDCVVIRKPNRRRRCVYRAAVRQAQRKLLEKLRDTRTVRACNGAVCKEVCRTGRSSLRCVGSACVVRMRACRQIFVPVGGKTENSKVVVGRRINLSERKVLMERSSIF